MRSKSPSDSSQSSFFDLLDQLDQNDPLIALGNALNWERLESAFEPLYSTAGRPAKPVRLMCGLLMLKQLENLSDESVVVQWRRNPYYQAFCGETQFQTALPCHATELVKFRQRIGEEGVKLLFGLSVSLHGKKAEEKTVFVDTTVQEKAITYPTDSKLLIKIINRLNKLAKVQGVQQRRTFVKEIKSLRLACRHFRHVKRRTKARKALKRLRTIAGILMRELQRKLPPAVLDQEQEHFALYQRVIEQRKRDKNKVYSLHEADVYCVGKGKDHKPYEYGRKASIVSTKDSNILVGVASHDENQHDSKTLKAALESAQSNRRKPIKMAVVDRGYRGAKKHIPKEIEVLLPSPPLKRDSVYQRQKKRILCRKRAAIEPIIGHLKQDYRLSRNWLKGSEGDSINLHMAACAWNLRKWMVAFFVYKNTCPVGLIVAAISANSSNRSPGEVRILCFYCQTVI